MAQRPETREFRSAAHLLIHATLVLAVIALDAHPRHILVSNLEQLPELAPAVCDLGLALEHLLLVDFLLLLDIHSRACLACGPAKMVPTGISRGSW